MPRKRPQHIPAILSALIISVVLPQMLGIWAAVAVLALLPVLTAAAAGMGVRQASVALVMGLIATFLLPDGAVTLPEWLLPPLIVWLAGCAGYACFADRLRAGGQAAFLCGLCTLTALLATLMAALHGRGAVITGLAGAICGRIDSLPMFDRARTLYTLYQSGLARLDAQQAELMNAGVKLLGVLGIPADLQEQLLWSLRTTLETLLPSLLPEGMVLWGIMTPVGTVLALEASLRARKGSGNLPPFGEWYLPTDMGWAAIVCFALGLLPLFTASGTLVTLGYLCRALGYWTLAMQGVCSMWGRMGDAGASTAHRTLMAVLGMAMIPMLYVIFGVHDHLSDPRGLRPDRDDDIY